MRVGHNVVAGLCCVALLSEGATDYRILKRYPVGGRGGWDYVTLDGAARRLYLSHATQVDVMDADTGKLLGTIPDTPGVHGIVVVTPKRGFISNGSEDKVSMFDPSTLRLIKKIDVGRGPDGIYFDPASNRVFTNNHGSHDITAISASSGEVVGTVKAEGDGEQAVIGADGLIYVNSENTAEVVVFDPKSLTVRKRFPIGVAKVPTGLAYDPRNNRLFIGCRSEPKMVVMDAATGRVVASFAIGGGVDFAAFDPEARLIFLSCGAGILNVFHQNSANEYEDGGAVKTQPGARTMALDPKTRRIFLPTAEYVESPGQPRRSVKPDTFVVLVVGKS